MPTNNQPENILLESNSSELNNSQPAPAPTAPSLIMPDFKMSRTSVKTVQSLWKEYSGVGENLSRPTIKYMNENFGERCRKQGGDDRFYRRRYAIWECIEILVKDGKLVDEACAYLEGKRMTMNLADFGEKIKTIKGSYVFGNDVQAGEDLEPFINRNW